LDCGSKSVFGQFKLFAISLPCPAFYTSFSCLSCSPMTFVRFNVNRRPNIAKPQLGDALTTLPVIFTWIYIKLSFDTFTSNNCRSKCSLKSATFIGNSAHEIESSQKVVRMSAFYSQSWYAFVCVCRTNDVKRKIARVQNKKYSRMTLKRFFG
jgi:hypothetical protein